MVAVLPSAATKHHNTYGQASGHPASAMNCLAIHNYSQPVGPPVVTVHYFNVHWC